jgi:hypothetical protein
MWDPYRWFLPTGSGVWQKRRQPHWDSADILKEADPLVSWCWCVWGLSQLVTKSEMSGCRKLHFGFFFVTAMSNARTYCLLPSLLVLRFPTWNSKSPHRDPILSYAFFSLSVTHPISRVPHWRKTKTVPDYSCWDSWGTQHILIFVGFDFIFPSEKVG